MAEQEETPGVPKHVKRVHERSACHHGAAAQHQEEDHEEANRGNKAREPNFGGIADTEKERYEQMGQIAAQC